MIRRLKTLVALAAIAGFSAAEAEAQLLTFEGLGNFENVLNYYNGGTGSYGNSGGNLGIGFLAGALAGIDSDDGGSFLFENNPSGNTVLFTPRYVMTMNVFSGFDNAFALSHSNKVGGEVRIWSGLNGSGQLLGILKLGGQHDLNCPPMAPGRSGQSCNFSSASIGFDGMAKSLQIVSLSSHGFYDDLDFNGGPGSGGPEELGPSDGGPGQGGPGGPENLVQPEPITTVLLGTGLAGIAGAARRRKQGAEVEVDEEA